MPSTAYSAPSKLALYSAWTVFTLSGIVTVISAARLPADGACWAWECLCVMIPALMLMLVSVHYLNKLSGSNLLYSAHKCAQTTETTEDKIQVFVQELHARLCALQLSVTTRQENLAQLEDILHHYCYPLSKPVMRAQLFVLTDPLQARQIVDALSRTERLVNRAWSALSDDYEAEAKAACAEAAGHCEGVMHQLSA